MKKDIFLNIDRFESMLEDNLTIVSYPSKKRRYYVCSVGKQKYNVYVTI